VDAEVIVEGGFELLASDAGVALLDLGEKTLLGGEQDACSVDIDGAAFENEAVRLRFGICGKDFGLNLGDVVELCDVMGNLVVEMPVRILGPGVELPVGDSEGGF